MPNDMTGKFAVASRKCDSIDLCCLRLVVEKRTHVGSHKPVVITGANSAELQFESYIICLVSVGNGSVGSHTDSKML